MHLRLGRWAAIAALSCSSLGSAANASAAPAASASAATSSAPAAASAASTPHAGRSRWAPAHARPAGAVRLACSWQQPVCVHGMAAGDETLALEALTAAEESLQQLQALGLPPLLPDDHLGGGPAFDVYLDSRRTGAAAWGAPYPLLGERDRAASFAYIGVRDADACQLRSDIARALAQAILLGFDAAVNDGLLAAHSSYLASLIAPCGRLEQDAVDAFQRRPDRALSRGSRTAMSGNLLFSHYLDNKYGASTPGAVMTGLIATSSQRTPLSAPRWNNEPDVFDALRFGLRQRGSNSATMLADFAVARAFVGDRSDGVHLPGSVALGAFGRVVFEWAIDFDSLPRRVAPLRAPEPGGASYLWLDLTSAPANAQLLFVAEWEVQRVMTWQLVKVDAQGRELGRLAAGGGHGDNKAQRTVADLSGAAALLIVGSNSGYDDRSQPFDPDDEVLHKSGWIVTLHAQ